MLLKGRNCVIAGSHGEDRLELGFPRRWLVIDGVLDLRGEGKGLGGELKLLLCRREFCKGRETGKRGSSPAGVVRKSCLEVRSSVVPQAWPRRTTARRIVS